MSIVEFKHVAKENGEPCDCPCCIPEVKKRKVVKTKQMQKKDIIKLKDQINAYRFKHKEMWIVLKLLDDYLDDKLDEIKSKKHNEETDKNIYEEQDHLIRLDDVFRGCFNFPIDKLKDAKFDYIKK